MKSRHLIEACFKLDGFRRACPANCGGSSDARCLSFPREEAELAPGLPAIHMRSDPMHQGTALDSCTSPRNVGPPTPVDETSAITAWDPSNQGDAAHADLDLQVGLLPFSEAMPTEAWELANLEDFFGPDAMRL